MNPRALLQKHGLVPKKSWGQNFLVDEGTYAAIVQAVDAKGGDTVVEIGAGLGTLTGRLCQTGAEVIAIERDRDMVRVLRAELPGLEILEANALRLDVQAIASRAGMPLILVGNLPYQIGCPIVIRLLEARTSIVRIIVMLQREVAERMVAPPGTKTYGALSVICQAYSHVDICRNVAAGAFFPPPKVESAIVRLVPRRQEIPHAIDASFRAIVDAAFQMRRKTLRNALRRLCVPEDFVIATVDPARRGETLTVEEFMHLATATSARKGHA